MVDRLTGRRWRFAAAAVLLVLRLGAEEPVSGPSPWTTLAPTILVYSGLLSSTELDFPINRFVNLGFLGVASVPSVFEDPARQGPGLLVGSVLIAGATMWSISDSSPLVSVVAGETANAGMKVLFWNAYQGSTASPEDPWQLALAPWDTAVVFQPSVLTATLISASVFTGWSYLQTGGQRSPLQSGRSYWNRFETDFWSGLALTAAIGVVSSTFTAIGEEGFFRGLQYTQLRSVAGQRVASLADVVLFAAAHIPQEVRSGLPAGVIAVNGLQRALAGWLLQNAFDQAGLEGSVAAHAWIDIIAEISNFLLNGGVATLDLSWSLK